MHTDSLGTVDTVANEKGVIIQRTNFGAFGMQRDGNWKESQKAFPPMKRGFTGHEHIGDSGFIHMNGRVYDTSSGRFLSPDPHVQDPMNTQALNRYSYVLNNPLKYNDPNGYFFRNPLKAIATITVSMVSTWAVAPLVGVIVGAFGLKGAAAAVTEGALLGAAGGFAGGTVATGSIRGGVHGAFGGAVFGGVDGHFGNTWNFDRVVSQSVAGGVVSHAMGGKFMEGLVSSGGAASARCLYNNVVEYDVDIRPGGDAVKKSLNGMPNPFRNNFGTQGKALDLSWFDVEQFMNINWGEGGGLSRVMNSIPGVNAVAGLHDVFQVRLDFVLFSGARDVFNVPGMIPAASITYIALHDGPGMSAFLVDESHQRDDKDTALN